jgi:hypothetical protein
MTEEAQEAPGRPTRISRDPIGTDPIGNDPLDLSDNPPQRDGLPSRSFLGWTGTAATFFTAAVILGMIMLIAIIAFALRT